MADYLLLNHSYCPIFPIHSIRQPLTGISANDPKADVGSYFFSRDSQPNYSDQLLFLLPER